MTSARIRRSGFALIEALIALVLILVGLVAVSQLQTSTLRGAGEAKLRSEAANIAQRQLEQLANQLQKGDYTALATGNTSVPGTYATYALSWTVTTPNATLEKKLVQLRATWTDSSGPQQLDLNSQVSWDDPTAAGKLLSDAVNRNLISPTGEAQRGNGPAPGAKILDNHDGTKIYRDGGKTYLTRSDGSIILVLPPKGDGTAQNFTTITGRIYFDENAGNNALPESGNVRVRLSSEGECLFNNANAALITTADLAYKYFTYTCYVGAGWYGNVGVTVNDNNGPKVCVGNPDFANNNTQTSAHPKESAVRTYRGFRAVGSDYLSTGVAEGRKYGYSYLDGGVVDPYNNQPFDGRHRPSEYPSVYGAVTAMSATDYLNQDFLLTKANASCDAKMVGTSFARNAGKYVCITPDIVTAEADVCPTVWPNFETEIGTGGTTNYGLDVAVLATGGAGGTVTSSIGGINCGQSCSASLAEGTSVVLAASPNAGSVFSGWSGGGCTGVSPCTVVLNTDTTVTATFEVSSTPPPPQYTLTVTKSGPGSGTVSSSPAGISCGATCNASFNSGAQVTLTATQGGGSTFDGWSGGGCSGTGSCTVTMDAAKSVVANFTTAVCTTPISGGLQWSSNNATLTVNPSNYGSCLRTGATYTCSFNAPTGTSLTLTHTNGSNSSLTRTVIATCAEQVNVNLTNSGN